MEGKQDYLSFPATDVNWKGSIIGEVREVVGHVEAGNGQPFSHDLELGWKLMSCSQCQELGQLADLASDWLFTLLQPIRSQFAC